MLSRLKPGLLAASFLLLAAFSQAAEAMVLSCLPAGKRGEQLLDAYIDGEAGEDYPPKQINEVRALVRLGEDAYEFFPEHAKEVELRDGTLRIHFLQPLSAGQTAELRIEGKIAERKGGATQMQVWLRNERREGRGEMRCTIE